MKIETNIILAVNTDVAGAKFAAKLITRWIDPDTGGDKGLDTVLATRTTAQGTKTYAIMDMPCDQSTADRFADLMGDETTLREKLKVKLLQRWPDMTLPTDAQIDKALSKLVWTVGTPLGQFLEDNGAVLVVQEGQL